MDRDGAAEPDPLVMRAIAMLQGLAPDDPGLRAQVITSWISTRLGEISGDADPSLVEGLVRGARIAAGIGAPNVDGTHTRAQLVLSRALSVRHKISGSPADLAEAIDLARRALDGWPPHEHVARTATLEILIGFLRTRFIESQDSAALAEAVDRQSRLLAAAGGSPARRAELSADLGGLLYLSPHGDAATVDRAIALYREALRLAPQAPNARSGHWHRYLGRSLARRADLPGGADGHLAEAIDLLREAAARAPAGSVPSSSAQADLSAAERRRAELAVLRKAEPVTAASDEVAAAWAALTGAPPGSAQRLEPLLVLGTALIRRFDQGRDPADREAAITCLREAGGITRGGAAGRIQALRLAGHLACEAGDWPAAAGLYRDGLDLLPGVLPTDLARADQERAVSRITTIGVETAAVALRAGAAPAEAFRLLERGRGVLLARSMNADLPGLGPDAAIPSVPGPLIAVSESIHGSYAFLVADGDVRALPLDTDHRDTLRRVTAFRRALEVKGTSFDPAYRVAAARLIDATLAWLWDAVAEPALRELGFPARVWWMPAGLFSHLPLHAAGRHRSGGRQTVLDRAVSSYTPTAWLLERASRARGGSVRRAVVLATPDVQGRDPLPSTMIEAAAVRRRFPDAQVRSGAGRAEVLDALRRHEWIHLACHAVSDEANPSASHLLLADGALGVTDIDQLRLPHAYLAYLSACETAQGGAELADQAVHVASAFQLAGYPHVVATLWPVGDRAATGFSEAFYAALDPADPAAGVHEATRRLRDRHGGASVLSWAGHIHIGP